MSGSRNSLASLGSFGAFAAGTNLAMEERDADLRNTVQRRALADDDYFRDSSAGILSGEQEALQGALARNPQRVAQMRGVQWAGEDRQRGEQDRVLTGTARLTSTLLNTDPAEWPTLWPRIREQGAALGLQLPEQVPTRAQVEQVAAATRTPAQNLAASENRLTVGPAQGGGGFFDRLQAMESGGNPNARNPRSTATGPFQFIDSTWQAYAAANPDRFQGMTPEQVMQRRTDPTEARAAAQWLAGQNAAALSGAGLPAGPGELALAHFAGAQGARALLQADPNTPAGQVLGEAVMRANPQLAGRTAGQVVDIYRRRFGDAPMESQPAAAPVMRNGVPVIQGNQQLVEVGGQRQWVPLERAANADRFQQVPLEGGGIGLLNTATGEIRRAEGVARPPTAAEQRTQTPARLPTALVRLDEEDIERIQTASVIQADAQEFIDQIDSGRLNLSGLGNLANRGLNFAGVSTQGSRAYAEFVASMERLRNDSLRLNTGVQTEGDAQRAWNELFQNLNDEQVVRTQLQRIQRINERAATLRTVAMNRRRQEAGAAPIEPQQIGVPTQPAAGQPAGQGAQQPARGVPPPAERVDGQTYQTPRGPMIWRGTGWEPAR